ncbi:NUDIX hydrolase [Rhodococcus sp. C26F]|jgi:8-oxo-dGTP pyrophosphatase MutT (NUDIX family)|uniref:NUDIX hydrolase n=1 Tax=Rhodococcus pyridinivorans KG-16 TaxID=1441730 RepID=A0A0V9UFB0_9NOCA|nr:CoA pyrophosphatase [Rhodococcus pyridinivorans]KSZ56643.1 NUDIX hydrolase [Rhodococcus pyridinivorans KG-16]
MIPEWLRRVASVSPTDPHGLNPILNRRAPRDARVRQASVLVLFGGSPEADPIARGGLPADADVLLTQRAATLRQHSGQVAFPGGAADPEDYGAIHTALREAEEETGLDPSGIRPLAVLPELFIPPSGFDVTPVVAYWETPSPVGVVDPGEATRVVRVSLHELLDPDNRFQVRHRLGYQGPAFQVDGMLVWGFTAGVLAGLFAVSGWEIEWDHHDVRDLDVVLAELETGVVES